VRHTVGAIVAVSLGDDLPMPSGAKPDIGQHSARDDDPIKQAH